MFNVIIPAHDTNLIEITWHHHLIKNEPALSQSQWAFSHVTGKFTGCHSDNEKYILSDGVRQL